MERSSGLRWSDGITVLVCLALALLTLGAVGQSGRGRAKEAVCQANLHQWHSVFQEIIQGNDGHFLSGVTDTGYWWPIQLPQELQDWKRNRTWFCPITPPPTATGTVLPSLGSLWGVFNQPATMTSYKGETYSMAASGIAGSYGLNGYVIPIPEKRGSKMNTYDQTAVTAMDGWQHLQEVPEASKVPMFLDALRFDLWPLHTNEPPRYEWETWTGSNYMTHCCRNRHDGAVNCLFVDGSVRKVGLKEHWTLKWHRSFDTAGPWTKAGGVLPTDWPEWMRPFKEY